MTQPRLFKQQRRLGTAKGMIEMSEDFNDPLEDFVLTTLFQALIQQPGCQSARKYVKALKKK